MKIILAIFIAVISLVTQPENTHAQELTVKSIQDDLKVKSPRKVVSSLYNDREKWNILLRNIVSGDIEWLKIPYEKEYVFSGLETKWFEIDPKKTFLIRGNWGI